MVPLVVAARRHPPTLGPGLGRLNVPECSLMVLRAACVLRGHSGIGRPSGLERSPSARTLRETKGKERKEVAGWAGQFEIVCFASVGAPFGSRVW